VTLQSFIEQATRNTKKTVAVAAAEHLEVMDAVSEAIKLDMANFLLFGNKQEIMQIINDNYPQLVKHANINIVHTNSKEHAAESAVRNVKLHEADVLMKGNVPTATLLKAVLNKEHGLRNGNVLSHVAVFEIPGYNRLTIVTDAAINIKPDLEQKVEIVKNAVEVAKWIGIDHPKVAVLAAVELVNPAMQATIDGAALALMNKRGQIQDCLVDGPLALDNAISQLAAKRKGINSDVAGVADILMVPTIEVGNVLYKSLIYFANASVGAVIAGAKAPIVLTSRADNAESKLFSLALALSEAKKKPT
jgi:phosphate butyryltransferase